MWVCITVCVSGGGVDAHSQPFPPFQPKNKTYIYIYIYILTKIKKTDPLLPCVDFSGVGPSVMVHVAL